MPQIKITGAKRFRAYITENTLFYSLPWPYRDTGYRYSYKENTLEVHFDEPDNLDSLIPPDKNSQPKLYKVRLPSTKYKKIIFRKDEPKYKPKPDKQKIQFGRHS